MRPAREDKKVVLSPQLNSEKGSAETEQRNISIRGGCRLSTSAQCVHCTVGFPCSKKSPVVATGECSYYRGITIATGE